MEKKNKAAQTLGRMSHAKRTKGMTKKQISEYYSRLSKKRNVAKTSQNQRTVHHNTKTGNKSISD